MSYIRRVDRGQSQLLPPSLEEYVAENAPVRLIEGFVDTLKLAELGFKRTKAEPTGRPGYDPRHLLGLYLYG